MPDINTIAHYMLSGDGRVVAAGLLFLLLYALERVPWVRDNVLTTPMRKRAAALLLAAAPAVATALLSDESTREVAITAIMAFATAAGFNAQLPHKRVPK